MDPEGNQVALSAFDPDFGQILDAISDGVYVTTAEREIVYWSRGAERITGYSAEEVVGKHCYDNILVHTDLDGLNLCLNGCPLDATIKSGAAEPSTRSSSGARTASVWRST